MAMTGFICHDDYLNKTAKLTDEEVGRLFRACMRYNATGEEQDLEGRESVAFDFIREDIDRARQAYTAKCETNRRNRQKGIEQTLTTVNDSQQTLTAAHNNKNKNKNKNNNKKVFTPPTTAEVAAYCQERKNSVNPERFIDFYTSKGWLIGKNPMKDWKAAVRTWEQSEGTKSEKPVKKNNYEQRSYENEQDAALMRLMGNDWGETG